MMKQFCNNFVGDYESAKKNASIKIVKKQSRGSIFAQNGWSLNADKLRNMSFKADVHIEHLRKALKAAK